MKNITFLLVSICVLFSGGCVSRPRYANQKTAESSLIRGVYANPIKFAFAGESNVTLVEVDGLYVPPGPFIVKDVYIQPGHRLITATLEGANYKAAQTTVGVDAEAQKRYRLTSTVVGIDFDVFLWDETDGAKDRVLIRKWRISGEQRTPMVIPIVIR